MWCLFTPSHPGWLQHPMLGTLPTTWKPSFVDTSGTYFGVLGFPTMLYGCTPCLDYPLVFKLILSGRERKERGSRRGKDEEEEKPILLETRSNHTCVPLLPQNVLCQGNRDCHVISSQLSFNSTLLRSLPPPETPFPVRAENTHSPGFPFPSLEIPV